MDLVSCLTITQKGREDFFDQACDDFRRQTYLNKEHVVVMGDMPLGALRNRALDAATGDYVCQWDDDDLYDETRIEVQLNALKKHGADACFLSRITMQCVCGHRALTTLRTWENTMMCSRQVISDLGLKYPAIDCHEDNAFVTELIAKGGKIIELYEPDLYVYRIHGGNVSRMEHFDAMFRAVMQFDHIPSECLAKRKSGAF